MPPRFGEAGGVCVEDFAAAVAAGLMTIIYYSYVDNDIPVLIIVY